MRQDPTLLESQCQSQLTAPRSIVAPPQWRCALQPSLLPPVIQPTCQYPLTATRSYPRSSGAARDTQPVASTADDHTKCHPAAYHHCRYGCLD